MILKLVVLVISMLITISTIGQKEDYMWLFGVDEMTFPGETGYFFDFNNPPMEVEAHDNNIGIGQANTSICDKNGNLMLPSLILRMCHCQ